MTELLRPDAVGVARAAALLHQGLLVAFGTETVYGLGADATNDCAVAAIFTAKERPWFNPLICHYADDDAALADVIAHDQARCLATAFWPGPLTLVTHTSTRLRNKPNSPVEGWIPWRCVFLSIASHVRCCGRPACRSPRHRPIARGA